MRRRQSRGWRRLHQMHHRRMRRRHYQQQRRRGELTTEKENSQNEFLFLIYLFIFLVYSGGFFFFFFLVFVFSHGHCQNFSNATMETRSTVTAAHALASSNSAATVLSTTTDARFVVSQIATLQNVMRRVLLSQVYIFVNLCSFLGGLATRSAMEALATTILVAAASTVSLR